MKHNTLNIDIGNNEKITITKHTSGTCELISTIEREMDNPEYNAAIDAIESLTLSLASAGVDITGEQYKEGLLSSLEIISHRLVG